MTSVRRLMAAAAATFVLAAGCSSSSADDSAAQEETTTSTAEGSEATPAESLSLVQDLWLYQRIATVDQAGELVELTGTVIDRLAGPTGSVDLGGGVTFHHHEELAARLVSGDGDVRDDVSLHAGVVDADGDELVAVLATPERSAEAPIDDEHRVQLELTLVEDLLAPGDPLIVDVGFLQAFGDGTDEDSLGGAELLAQRLAAGRANLVGTSGGDGDSPQLLLTRELGVAVEGSVWGDLPAKSHRMMDGFRKSFQGCRGVGLKCVKNYFDEMVDVAVDFGRAFDCNIDAAFCTKLPPEPTTTTTTTPPRPPQPIIPGGGAKVHGDPHLRTFDGHSYGMQAVGEFVAARREDVEVQIRTAPLGESRSVSVLSGVAVAVDGHVLSVVEGAVHLDGDLIEPGPGFEPVPLGDATLARRGNGFEITTGSGVQVGMTNVSSRGFELWMTVPDGDSAAFEGLFGDNDGDIANDLAARDGEVLVEPAADELYGTFVESWRLSDDESHFHYAEGESTETFTDRSFPEEELTLATLPAADRARAAAICRAAGVVDETTLDECTLDYAVSGDIGFVRAALTIDVVIGVWQGRLLADGSEVDAGGADGSGRLDLDDVRTVRAPWSLTASELREGDEAATRVTCPEGGSPHTVWGTDTYSDDSSVCTAAVHAGLITFDEGGDVLVGHRPGRDAYQGSSRNGVTTREWASWPASFVLLDPRGAPITGG